MFLGRSGQLQDEILNADDDVLVDLARGEVRDRLGVASGAGRDTGPSLAAMACHSIDSGIRSAWHGSGRRCVGTSRIVSCRQCLSRASGIPDCVASGEGAADAAATHLASACAGAGTPLLSSGCDARLHDY